MHGYIYIAKQNDNPFDNFLSLYFVIEDPDRGLRVKIPGKIELDPVTGQITTTFDDLPQFPISDMQLTFKGGVRAALVNPSTCGTKTITADFYSWADPNTPVTRPAPTTSPKRPTALPASTASAIAPSNPQLTAGTDPAPGRQLLAPSSSASPAPTTTRSSPSSASPCRRAWPRRSPASPSAQTRHRPGDPAHRSRRRSPRAGRPLLPGLSQIGTSEVGTGVGVPLTYVPGKVYLAGPYQGAPL